MSIPTGIEKICVLGASGRLGGTLVQHFGQLGLRVRAACRDPISASQRFDGLSRVEWAALDLKDFTGLRNLIRGCDATIFAIGANHPCYSRHSEAVVDFQHVNTKALLDVANAVILEGNSPLIHLGSLFSLGMSQKGCVNEQTLPKPETPFEISEREGEHLLIEASEVQGLNSRILRLPPVLDGGKSSGLLTQLIEASNSTVYRKQFVRYETTSKPAILSKDMVTAIEAAMNPDLKPLVCNLSSGDLMLGDLVRAASSQEQSTMETPERSVDFQYFLASYLPYDLRVDLSHALRVLEYEPTFPIRSRVATIPFNCGASRES